MANNFTMASFVVLMPEDQAAWFLSPERPRCLAADETEETPACWATLATRLADQDLEHSGLEHLEYRDGKLWFAGMESFNPDYVAILLHEWMLAFDIKERPVSFQFAEICDKPRCDEFGGGAVVVTHDGIEFLHTATWARGRMIESL